ncbi:hypothetical protein ANO11243_011560 [Dothideomycetidae sp. 11243]|nr:hypothetical protein ANO11243_011560 [fungal sp. No.11243]
MSSSARGRGGKFSKPKRGGGKHFSRNLRPVDAEGVEKSIWASQSSSGDSSSEEDSSSDDDAAGGPSNPRLGNTASLGNEPATREERRAAAKARKAAAIKRKTGPAQPGDLPTSDEESSEDEAMPANPNHTAKARAQAVAPTPKADADEDAEEQPKKRDAGNLSRREREALNAQQAKERYQKLQAAGKTDEARADLERLKLVRQKREEDAARKEAERQEKEEHEKAKSEQMAREERQRALAAGKKARGGKKK